LITGHGGNIIEIARQIGCNPADIHDMSSNMNPLGPFPGLMGHLKNRMDAILSLPQADASGCINRFAKRYGVDPRRVLAGNGTTQLIYLIPKALGSKKALILGPTYADYADACRMHRVPHGFYLADEEDEFRPDLDKFAAAIRDADTIFICNPNNPTGTLISKTDVAILCRRYPEKQFVIDEAYMPFVGPDHQFSMIGSELPNLLVLNSMSKIFRVPGLRIGFLVAPTAIADRFRRFAMPWSLNSLAQEAILYLMSQRESIEEFVQKTQQFMIDEIKYLNRKLNKKEGGRLFPSHTSFILMKLPKGLTAESVVASLLTRRILVRNCTNFFGLSHRFIRISLKTSDINVLMADALIEILRRRGMESARKVA